MCNTVTKSQVTFIYLKKGLLKNVVSNIVPILVVQLFFFKHAKINQTNLITWSLRECLLSSQWLRHKWSYSDWNQAAGLKIFQKSGKPFVKPQSACEGGCAVASNFLLSIRPYIIVKHLINICSNTPLIETSPDSPGPKNFPHPALSLDPAWFLILIFIHNWIFFSLISLFSACHTR